jgi:hypothetical protein
MKRLNIGDFIVKSGRLITASDAYKAAFVVIAVKNSIAVARGFYGDVIYVSRGGFAGGA